MEYFDGFYRPEQQQELSQNVQLPPVTINPPPPVDDPKETVNPPPVQQSFPSPLAESQNMSQDMSQGAAQVNYTVDNFQQQLHQSQQQSQQPFSYYSNSVVPETNEVLRNINGYEIYQHLPAGTYYIPKWNGLLPGLVPVEQLVTFGPVQQPLSQQMQPFQPIQSVKQKRGRRRTTSVHTEVVKSRRDSMKPRAPATTLTKEKTNERNRRDQDARNAKILYQELITVSFFAMLGWTIDVKQGKMTLKETTDNTERIRPYFKIRTLVPPQGENAIFGTNEEILTGLRSLYPNLKKGKDKINIVSTQLNLMYDYLAKRGVMIECKVGDWKQKGEIPFPNINQLTFNYAISENGRIVSGQETIDYANYELGMALYENLFKVIMENKEFEITRDLIEGVIPLLGEYKDVVQKFSYLPVLPN